jgi:Fe2+ transport protein
MAALRLRRIWRSAASHSAIRGAVLVVVAGALLCGCGTSSKAISTTSRSSTGRSSTGRMAAATTNPAAPSAMSGMNGGSSSKSGSGQTTAAKAVDGVTPIPTQTLGTADWQHMKIMAEARTAVPFVIYDGTNEKLVKPSQRTSFHLMVMLSDDRTNYPIPYASVWATIRRGSKIVFDERQWPMISEYMGPHYGNNVTLPGPGTYSLSLLVSPPVSARHIEYAHIWLQPHRVNFTFRWNPSS